MEGEDQRRRQYEQPAFPRGYDPNYAAQPTSAPNPQQFRGTAQGDNSDRFRQAQLVATRPPTSASMIAGPLMPPDMGGYGYGSGQQYTNPQIQGPQFPYQPDYLQESQRQRHPPYQQHQPQMMYGAQQHPQTQPSYGHMGGYQPGQTAAVEVLSSQFGVPQQYYNTAETTTTSAPTAFGQGYQAAVHAQLQYNAANTIGHSTLVSAYPTLAPNLDQTAGSDVSQPLEQDLNLQGDEFARYERAVCETNENTSRGRLVEAGSSLRRLTDWLLKRAGDLGLTRDTKDNQPLYRQRLLLWDNFNNCWLAFLQRQKDDTQQMRDSRQSPVAPQNLMTAEALNQMVEELIERCDGLESSGLVDYQMGVAEEEIISLVHKCCDLLGSGQSSNVGQEIAEDPGATTSQSAPVPGAR